MAVDSSGVDLLTTFKERLAHISRMYSPQVDGDIAGALGALIDAAERYPVLSDEDKCSVMLLLGSATGLLLKGRDDGPVDEG